MARKGSQQKNSVDGHSSKTKKTVSDLEGSFSEKLSGGKISKAELGANGKTNDVVDEKRSASNSEKLQRKDKQEAESMHDQEESVSYESISRDCFGTTSGTETLKKGTLHSINNGRRKFPNFVLEYLTNGLQMENAMSNLVISYNALCRNLRATSMSIYKAANEWLERQKPLFFSIKSNTLNARDHIRRRFRYAYPIVFKWLIYFGNIILLLLMVWLDCFLRGMDSFLRMRTASVFSVIWCSILSVMAMIGISKFLLVLVLPVLLGLFVGITFSILALALTGVVLLWLYGSFWTTTFVLLIGGLAFAVGHDRAALFMTTVYSVYCAWNYVGFLGLLLGLNLSFISSDALIYFLKNRVNEPRSGGPSEPVHPSFSETDPGVNRGPGIPSTSGADSDLTSEEEVIRLLNCADHYSAFGFSRFANVDASLLKREYRKKAMLVHPDKNMGNEKAAEAFKKLQNAYEVLLDSLKRTTYDEELKREELLNYFRTFQGASRKNGRHGFFPSGFPRSDTEADDPFRESRQIACKKCGNFHIWIYTNKAKARARWCQDCNDFHPAKDGDGWVEQSSQPFFFGLLQKVEAPSAYVCAESKVYDATEWYMCQGMRCPANTHKASFQANTSVISKQSSGKGASSSTRRGSGVPPPPPDMEDAMTEEQLYEWLQNAMQSGAFDPFAPGTSSESPSARPENNNASASKRKKKGKKQR